MSLHYRDALWVMHASQESTAGGDEVHLKVFMEMEGWGLIQIQYCEALHLWRILPELELIFAA